MRPPAKGTVKRPASEVLKNPERWFYIEVDTDYSGQMNYWMEKQVHLNQGYDKWCIASFFWYKRLGDPNKAICSEFCQNALSVGGIFDQFKCPSPCRLAYQLIKMGYKIERL